MDEDDSYDIAIAHADGLSICVPESILRAAVVETLRRHNVQRASISIALVDDNTIAKLNESHLDHKGPTDVLTFDLRDDATAPPNEHVEGEIVVSAETATREADRRKHQTEAEVALYTVHGTLHLLGYDDQSEAQAARMHESEDAILSAVDIGPVYQEPRQ